MVWKIVKIYFTKHVFPKQNIMKIYGFFGNCFFITKSNMSNVQRPKVQFGNYKWKLVSQVPNKNLIPFLRERILRAHLRV